MENKKAPNAAGLTRQGFFSLCWQSTTRMSPARRFSQYSCYRNRKSSERHALRCRVRNRLFREEIGSGFQEDQNEEQSSQEHDYAPRNASSFDCVGNRWNTMLGLRIHFSIRLFSLLRSRCTNSASESNCVSDILGSRKRVNSSSQPLPLTINRMGTYTRCPEDRMTV